MDKFESPRRKQKSDPHEPDQEGASRTRQVLHLALAVAFGFLLALALSQSTHSKQVSEEPPEQVQQVQAPPQAPVPLEPAPALPERLSENPPPDSWGRLPPSSVSLPSPGGAIWKFKSQVWDGYIDIRTDGRYYTHWGYGHWGFQPDGSVLLVNDYDGFTHHLTKVNKTTWKGDRNDGTWERMEFVWDYAHDPRSQKE